MDEAIGEERAMIVCKGTATGPKTIAAYLAAAHGRSRRAGTCKMIVHKEAVRRQYRNLMLPTWQRRMEEAVGQDRAWVEAGRSFAHVVVVGRFELRVKQRREPAGRVV